MSCVAVRKTSSFRACPSGVAIGLAVSAATLILKSIFRPGCPAFYQQAIPTVSFEGGAGDRSFGRSVETSRPQLSESLKRQDVKLYAKQLFISAFFVFAR